MAYTEDVNVNLNVLSGTMGGISAIMGGMSALTSSFGAIATEAANSFGTLDGLLITSATFISMFAAKSAEAYGEFEQGMKIVQAVSGQTGAAIQQLGEQANQLSVSYHVAIGDITEGLQTLGRAGLNSASEQIEVLESGLQTAKLEGRNLNGVLEELIQNTTMLGGELKSVNFGEQSEYVNSLLVGTSMTAPIDSHDISQTLQYAGGTAAAAGANISSPEGKEKLEDLMGTVAAFAQKGVKGSMAGTALRAFFTKPPSQDESVVNALGGLGLAPEDLWEDGGESMKSVSDQIAIIKRHMDALNLSTMDQIEIWGKIVGPKMGQQMMKLDSATIKDLTRDIQSAQSAEDLAAKTLQTYTQKLSEMQQQGEVAFREFGEKAVVFMAPVVEIVASVLNLLSNPIVNTSAFVLAGSLIAHGFRVAYSMITTVYRQIKALIGETISGIQTIAGMTGSPVGGISQSASAVEILNMRLAETNAELAAMQAQFMGIQAVSKTGTYVAPLGITDENGKIPANMISTMKQDVFVGNGEMIGGIPGETQGTYLGIGERGRYYDRSEMHKLTDEYKNSVKEFNKGQQEIIAQQKEGMKYTKLSGEQIYLSEEGANAFVAHQKQFDTNMRAKAEFEGRALGQNPNWIMSSNQVDEHLAKQYPMISDKTVKDNIKKFTTVGEQTIHSSLTSMTNAEFEAWENKMKASQNRLNAFEKGYKGIYYDSKGDFNYEKFNRDQIHAENLRRHNELRQRSPRLSSTMTDGRQYHRVNVMSPIKERMLEEETILQKQAQLKAFEQQRNQVITQQQALASGRGQGAMAKGKDVFTQRIQGYSNWINKATTGTRQFAISGINSLKRLTGQFSLNSEVMQEKFAIALDKIEMQLSEAPITFEQALVMLQEELGVTAAELSTMLQETSLGLGKFNTRLMGLGLSTVEGAVATEEHTAAIFADVAAIEKSTLSKFVGGGISKIQSLVGIMGGPFMAGMLALTVGMQAIQSSQQAWQKSMQEAEEKINEAMDKQNEAAENIKTQYSKDSGDTSEIGAQNALIDAYAQIYDASQNQSIKLDENTAELMRNTESVKNKVDATNDITMDRVWGVSQWGSEFSDRLGTFSTWTTDLLSDFGDAFTMTYNTSDRSWFNINENPNGADWGAFSEGYERTSGEGYFDNHNIVLTASQRDDNYPWLKEFTPVLSADIWDLGIEGGLKQAFGGDFNKITDILESTTGKKGMDAWNDTTYGTQAQNIKRYFGTAEEQNRLQYSLKNYQSDFQNIGYQTRFFEKASGGKSALQVFRQGAGITGKHGKPVDVQKGFKGLEKASKKDTTRLINYIKALSIKTGMDEQRVLLATQLQQLQDMQQIANDVVSPNMLSQTEQALQQTAIGIATHGTTQQAANGAVTAGDNARAIAALLQVEMEGKLKEGAQDYAIDTLGINEAAGMSDEEVYAQAIEGYNKMQKTGKSTKWGRLGEYYLKSYATANAALWGRSGESQDKFVNSFMSGLDKKGTNFKAALDTLRKGGQGALTQQILEQYDLQAANANTDKTGGAGSGGGSGGGSGDDADKDTGGSTKSRVDLVLCSKKTIPKLNVNLFKKAPNFTIQNKNFSLRDIKINTEDKPDAITDALKNGIINAQKRMDPKIIQSEESVYDPVTATDGTTTPKGNTPVSSS